MIAEARLLDGLVAVVRVLYGHLVWVSALVQVTGSGIIMCATQLTPKMPRGGQARPTEQS